MKGKARKMSFLIADDDIDDRLMINDAFAKCEPEIGVDTVEDGEEAIQYLRREGPYKSLQGTPLPDVIILDLNMPRKDGREALQELKNDPKLRSIPVVILTTSKEEEDMLRGYDLGCASYITKPVNFEGLVELMRALGRYWIEFVELPHE